MNAPDLRYPIGKFIKPTVISADELKNWITTIAAFPQAVRDEIADITDVLLDTPYREGGWTARQVVHHCADSHMIAFIRFKLALTEDNPVIKPYEEALWAELADSKYLDVAPSLAILEAVHQRWVVLLNNCDTAMLKRKFTHPAQQIALSLDEVVGMYAWHGQHHLAHIRMVKQQNNRK